MIRKKRHGERTAKSLRQEAAADQSLRIAEPSTLTPLSAEKRRAMFVLEAPLKWMVVGADVDYCAVIGGPPTLSGCKIVAPPFRMPGNSMRWVTFIDNKRGWIAIEALQEAG